MFLGEGNLPPTEFRLFVRGWNETENGKFLFDEESAKAVMSAYKSWGVDLAIDLEHQMLGDAGPDPTARDARGWCKLELRPDGSLWAVNVKWTPDGMARLSEKRQRYISPAFEIDSDTKRVTKMVNVAITAMPATHKTPALVAASKGMGMDPALVMKALDALEAGDAKGALEILKNLIATAAGAEATEEGEDGDGSEGDGAEGQPTMEKVEEPKIVDAAAPEMGEDGDDGDGKDDDEKPAKKAAYKAARVMLRHMTNKVGIADQLAEIELWRTSHVTLSAERAKLAKERAALEAEERRALCVSLIKLGAEFPATVWADDKASALQSRWLSMPITELRGHVKAQKLARNPKEKSTNEVKPPNGSAGGAVVTLSAEELKYCQELKCDPKIYAELKAFRDGKKA